MIFPKHLTERKTIGMTAPSAGILEKAESYDRSVQCLIREGFWVVETANVRSGGIVSGSGRDRAEELHELYKNDDIDAIMCATGGDFLMEILPYVDYKLISRYPKWIQGYSDPTGLLYTITTTSDIATLYGPNGGSYDMPLLHESLKDNLEILKGNLVKQHSFPSYQSGWGADDGGYCLDRSVKWETPNGTVDETGRLIGGCLDVLLDLVGTKYDHTKEFIQRYWENISFF